MCGARLGCMCAGAWVGGWCEVRRLVRPTWLRRGGGVAVDQIKQRIGEHAAGAAVDLRHLVCKRRGG